MEATFTGQEIYSNQIFKALTPQLAPLKAFSTDFTQEAKAAGEGVTVQLVSADTVGKFRAEAQGSDKPANNFARSASENKKVTVTFGEADIVGFNVTPYQIANFNPGWWKEKANLNADEMADSILTGVCANITAGNFAKKFEIASDTEITLDELAALKAYAGKQKLNVSRCALGLDLTLMAKVESFYNKVKSGLTYKQVTSELARALGVRMVFGVPQLPEGLLGFLCAPSALAVAGRNFRPASDKPYESVREIVDPETGIGMTMVEFCEGTTGNLHESVTGLFASEVGVKEALIRIVKKAG